MKERAMDWTAEKIHELVKDWPEGALPVGKGGGTTDVAMPEGVWELAKKVHDTRAQLARVEGERDEHRSTLLTLESNIAMLETMVYETAPGEYSPDGWTFKQAFAAECVRRKEAVAERDSAKAEIRRLRGILHTIESQIIGAEHVGDREMLRQLAAESALTPAPLQTKAPEVRYCSYCQEKSGDFHDPSCDKRFNGGVPSVVDGPAKPPSDAGTNGGGE